MKLSTSTFTILLSTTLSVASSLAVYQDNSFYTYTPKTNFIGFTKNVEASCEGDTLSLLPLLDCPASSRLCKVYHAAEESSKRLNMIRANTKVLEQFMTLPQPNNIDAKSWIQSAKLLGEEQSSLLEKEKILKKRYQQEKQHFLKQSPSEIAKETSQPCVKALELRLPYGQIAFSTSYEANLEHTEIHVTQYLHITNRSGIDIQADQASFYYRSARQHVRPIHFSPWIVSKYVAPKKRLKKSMPMMRAQEEMMSVMETSMSADVAHVPVARYEDAREYSIDHLTLPSSGVPLEVKVLSWSAALSCETKAYPYARSFAFEVCAFSPKYPIDANRWKVRMGNEVINEKALGEYRDEKYAIYTKVDEEIQVKREPIVQKERETGIFGGTARKKDGFTLTLTNTSNQAKTLTVVERIPTSTTTEISSKLLSITSKEKVTYKMLKNGEIELPITLAANESRKLEVLFELSYDKDIKVSY